MENQVTACQGITGLSLQVTVLCTRLCMGMYLLQNCYHATQTRSEEKLGNFLKQRLRCDGPHILVTYESFAMCDHNQYFAGLWAVMWWHGMFPLDPEPWVPI